MYKSITRDKEMNLHMLYLDHEYHSAAYLGNYAQRWGQNNRLVACFSKQLPNMMHYM